MHEKDLFEQTYLEGLRLIVQHRITSVPFICLRLGISYIEGNEIIIGAEEMGILTLTTNIKPHSVTVSIDGFFNNINFYIIGIKARMHDFNSVEGIRSIAIPNYESISGIASPVNNIEYILQRRATRHKKNDRIDLAIECLRKSNEIMPHSNFQYGINDYLRLCSYLESEQRFNEALTELKCFETWDLSYSNKFRLFLHFSKLYLKISAIQLSSLYSILYLFYKFLNCSGLYECAVKNNQPDHEKNSMRKMLEISNAELNKALSEINLNQDEIDVIKYLFKSNQISEEDLRNILTSQQKNN